jgi:hypothetical protein
MSTLFSAFSGGTPHPSQLPPACVRTDGDEKSTTRGGMPPAAAILTLISTALLRLASARAADPGRRRREKRDEGLNAACRSDSDLVILIPAQNVHLQHAPARRPVRSELYAASIGTTWASAESSSRPPLASARTSSGMSPAATTAPGTRSSSACCVNRHHSRQSAPAARSLGVLADIMIARTKHRHRREAFSRRVAVDRSALATAAATIRI